MAVSNRAVKRVRDRLKRLRDRKSAIAAEYKAKLDPIKLAIADERAVLDEIAPTPEPPEPVE